MAALSTLAEEKSTYPVIVSFLDDDKKPVVPNTLSWSLYKKNGVVVNEREEVAVTPAQEVTIVIYGDDLAIEAGETRVRTLLVEGTYDSDLGADLPLRSSVRFTIDDLKGVS